MARTVPTHEPIQNVAAPVKVDVRELESDEEADRGREAEPERATEQGPLATEAQEGQ